MKICLVYGVFPPTIDGGADYCLELGKGFRDAGFDVSILTGVSDGGEEVFLDGIDIFRIVANWGVKGIFGNDRKIVKDFFEQHDFRYTIVIYPCAGMRRNYLLPALFPGMRGVGNFRIIWFTPVPPRPNPLELFAALVLAIRANAILCEDNRMTDVARRYLFWWKDKIRWIAMGPTLPFNLQLQAPIPVIREKHGLSEDAYYLTFFGYWYNSKGVDLLVKAVHELQNSDLVRKKLFLILLGGRDPGSYGAYERGIIELVRELKMEDKIIITGKVSVERVQELLVASDLYVLPFRRISTGRSTLVPAVKLGLPTILGSSTEVTGYFKHAENVYVVRPNSLETLKDGIVNMLSDNDLRYRVASNIFRLSPAFEWSAVAQSIVEG